MNLEYQSLNSRYAVPGHLSFHEGPNGLATAVVNNVHAVATVTLAGAQVMSYIPHGAAPVLWVSPSAIHTVGKAMRGGIPICWPWFGSHPVDPGGRPMHGLVRTMLWTFTSASACPDGSTELHITVRDTPETRALWPYRFELEAVITVGRKLRVAWIARNPGDAPYTYTGALHPYFTVSDVNAITIRGLDGLDYLDKTETFQRKTQTGPLQITGETDRVYLNTTAGMAIVDPSLGRTIYITKEGSRTSVVWNPGQKDEQMADVGARQHKFFVCVEAANAVDDVVTVTPGGEGRLAMEIWSERGSVS